MTYDHGLCPLDSHKPLIKAKPVFAAAQTFLRKASRLDRNFYMGALLFLLGSACFVLRCCRGCFLWVRTFLGASPKKIQHNIRFYHFIRLKSFSVFSIVVFATISGATFFISAILSMTCTIIPLSQRFPRFGSGAI